MIPPQHLHLSVAKVSALNTSSDRPNPPLPQSPTEQSSTCAVADAIQPHGALVALRSDGTTILACSANTVDFLGLAPERLLGRSIDVLELPELAALLTELRALPPDLRALGLHAAVTPPGGEPLPAFLHEHGGRAILEVERPQAGPENNAATAPLLGLMPGIAGLRDAAGLEAIAAHTAHAVRRMTGLDQVIVCRFDAFGNGEVVAKDQAPDWDHAAPDLLPGAALPAIAFDGTPDGSPRVRVIPDHAAEPVPLLRADTTVPPPDLAHAQLRSPAPARLDFLRRMGAGAALTVPVAHGGKPWGVISGHHRRPYGVPLSTRMLAAMAADALSLMLDTAERAVERERRVAQAARQAEVNRAKSDFLTGMSHELRTPLNAIIGYADFLLHPGTGPLTDRQRDCIGNIRASGSHLLELINDVLDLSKIEAGHVALHDEDVDVAVVVGEVYALQELSLASAGLAFDASFPRPLPRLRADRRSLRQILLNLLSNAIKFTPKGGRVAIDVTRTEEMSGAGLRITVVDSGVGIPEEHRLTVLEPFRQVPGDRIRSGAGTGLGLPIVRSLVEAHGGRLALSSAPGQGTRIDLHFPPDRVIA
ncbi:GAF domain-containing protein [Azospirillum brasilense]|nr:GAF domain-containing protein [Azospirillum brasilense]NUB33196.1 GAF domain-containing protein [Azospirillum brasilense]RIW08436.1 GAF domain-containing protein [Azospirillum brasilense]